MPPVTSGLAQQLSFDVGPQSAWPVAPPTQLGGATHSPPMHVSPVAQAVPHVPQLVVVPSVVSQPFAALASQLALPVLHVSPQTPPTQLATPPAVGHTLPHDEQLVVVPVGVSQPLATSLSQLPQPALQRMLQAPFEHEAAPLVVLHAVVHEPQAAAEVSRFISQPLSG